MRTSPKGIAAIERHEYVVLRAYQDIVGVWTIGAGLTAASGVVTPRAGMEITREEARDLLDQALWRNYEPRVRKALARGVPSQYEFDAAVSFDFNTGAIHRASWVGIWATQPVDWGRVEHRFNQWNKAKGKVINGLVNRRRDEFQLLKHGIYPGGIPATPSGLAGFSHTPTAAQLAAIRTGLSKLGFAPGTAAAGIARQAVLDFQTKYGLRADGIIGPATLHTLQRALDERSFPALIRLLRRFT